MAPLPQQDRHLHQGAGGHLETPGVALAPAAHQEFGLASGPTSRVKFGDLPVKSQQPALCPDPFASSTCAHPLGLGPRTCRTNRAELEACVVAGGGYNLLLALRGRPWEWSWSLEEGGESWR